MTAPKVSVLLREVEADNGSGHARIDVWVGRPGRTRGKAGVLVMSDAEWDDLLDGGMEIVAETFSETLTTLVRLEPLVED